MRDSIALVGGGMIIRRSVGYVLIVGFEAKERSNGIELENNLLEPKLVRYNKSKCNGNNINVPINNSTTIK